MTFDCVYHVADYHICSSCDRSDWLKNQADGKTNHSIMTRHNCDKNENTYDKCPYMKKGHKDFS